MSRPYYNFISKDGTLPLVDMGIKRKDINAAIEKCPLLRRSSTNITKSSRYDPENALFKLAPEVRNMIYTFALDIGSITGSRTRVPYSLESPTTECGSTSALRLCKETNVEASSLMEAFDVAYVPIMATMDYAALIADILRHGLSSLTPTQSTIFASLTTFMNVHLHLHISHWLLIDSTGAEPYLESRTAYIYGRLRQALLIFSYATTSTFERLGQDSIKRKAVVHFDHLFSDWRHMLTMAGCYKFKHLTRIMGEDKNTNWEVRYYVHAGGQKKAQQWSEWDERLTRDFRCLEEECRKFPNIKLVAEVYGELTWSLERKIAGVTRCITPSSTLWPSWPDDVPWRTFERVPSDEAVPPGDVASHTDSDG